MTEQTSTRRLESGARVIRAGEAADRRDGSGNLIRLRPGGMAEILLDREVEPGQDRLRVMPSADLTPVTPDLSHLPPAKRSDDDTVRNYRAWYDLPYSGVPWNTSRGVVHKVVAIHGTIFTGWQSAGTRVVGVTACGKGRNGNLELDRDDSGMFPRCKHCWKDES